MDSGRGKERFVGQRALSSAGCPGPGRPCRPQREPVPWAHVLRGGGVAAEFYVDRTRSLDELRRDWTATHELSHMLLPYINRGDAWLSEGFASYYQNVLRARAGMLAPEQAWNKLYRGFQRGRDGTRGRTLAEASRSMGRDRAFMRVYWSGAAIALTPEGGEHWLPRWIDDPGCPRVAPAGAPTPPSSRG